MTSIDVHDARNLLEQAGEPNTPEERIARAQILATLAIAEQLAELVREVGRIDWRHSKR